MTEKKRDATNYVSVEILKEGVSWCVGSDNTCCVNFMYKTQFLLIKVVTFPLFKFYFTIINIKVFALVCKECCSLDIPDT